MRAPRPALLAGVLALKPWITQGAEAKRRTDCERAGSKMLRARRAGGCSGFVVLGLRVAATYVGCDNTGGSCSHGASQLDLKTRGRISGSARRIVVGPRRPTAWPSRTAAAGRASSRGEAPAC